MILQIICILAAVVLFIFNMPYEGLIMLALGLAFIVSSLELPMFILPIICFSIGTGIFWQPGIWYYSLIAFGVGTFFLIPAVVAILMGIIQYLKYIKANEVGGGTNQRRCDGCQVLYLVDDNRMAYDKWYCQNCGRKWGV